MTSRPPPHSAGERCAELWLELEGLRQVAADVDPADEMLRTIERADPGSFRARLEYLRTGREAWRLLEHVQEVAGRPLGRLDAVLDFAAGWGRVTRFLAAALGPQRVVACDVEERANRSCGERLGVATVASALDPDALELPRRFPLIFVGSLFTHLPRPRFEAWLRRLLAALEPDGTLVLSTHGADLGVDLGEDGFVFERRTPIDYLPVEEYGTTWVAPAKLAELARDAGAAQVVSLEQALWHRHDVHVVRPGARAELEGLTRPPLATGRIERAWRPRPGHGWIGGWAQSPAEHGPVAEVSISVDGRRIGAANLGEPRRGDASGRAPSRSVRRDFYDEGDVSALGGGTHWVAACAACPHGPVCCLDVVPLEP